MYVAELLTHKYLKILRYRTFVPGTINTGIIATLLISELKPAGKLPLGVKI
jgi:hypothetical protein